jgi:hypothetical protein
MKTLFFCLMLLSFSCFAQKKIKTLEVSDTITQGLIDRPGDLYLFTKSGQLHKYDQDGHLLILYKTHSLPTLFDPRDGARLFAYYRMTQHYEYRTPSFEVTQAFRIDSSFVIQPWLICPSGDHKLWVLDSVDHTLKKINPRDSEVEVEVSIDTALIRDVTVFHTMREYQGFVFLHDPAKGIHVFNGMGKHIKTISIKGIHSFNFLGEELYYFTNGFIRFFDLFSAETRETKTELQGGGDILISDQRLFHMHGRNVDIYEYKP